MSGHTVELPAFEKDDPCPACGGVPSETTYHPGPALDRHDTWPCGACRPAQLGPHQCRTCNTCGYRWMQALAAPVP